MGWVVNVTPRRFTPVKETGTHCVGGWVGPRAGLDGWGKFRLLRDEITGPSSHFTILGARKVTRDKFHTENPQIFRRHRTKLSLPSCTPLPDVSLSATRSTHVSHGASFTHVSLYCTTRRRPEPWLDSFGYINSYNYTETRL
jgi:hypothetical protein